MRDWQSKGVVADVGDGVTATGNSGCRWYSGTAMRTTHYFSYVIPTIHLQSSAISQILGYAPSTLFGHTTPKSKSKLPLCVEKNGNSARSICSDRNLLEMRRKASCYLLVGSTTDNVV